MSRIASIEAIGAELTGWRHHLHSIPELQFDCFRTSAFVAEKLRSFGVDEVVEGMATSGVVAVINGKGPGITTGLRADMDALPIEELRDLPYRSTVPGVMHACGHDGHTTMLLGAAKHLAETRNFAGRAVLIFQPAEEGGGGADVMCREGLMTRFGIERVFALHNWPGMDAGRIETRAGPAMAASDAFDVIVTGTGAHAAQPHNGRDPIFAATAMVQALQTIVSRTLDPVKPAVLSVTQFQSGSAYNVIPDEARFSGTFRSLDDEVRAQLLRRLEEIVSAVARANGVRADVIHHPGYPVTVNDADAAGFAMDVAESLVGTGNIERNRLPEMGAEDFAYMLEQVPGAYVFLGQGESAGLHHPRYDFNDKILTLGASYLARLVEEARPF